MCDSVDIHHPDYSRVMDLYADDRVIHYEATPLRVHRRRLLKHSENALDQPNAAVGLDGRETEATPCRRGPRADVPEFDYVLGSSTELVAAG